MSGYAQEASVIKGKRVSPLYKRALAIIKTVEAEGRTVDKLTAQDFTRLPVGLVKEIGGKKYVIAIDSAYQNDQGWFFTAYAVLTIPGTTEPLAFAGRGLAFNAGGLAATNSAKLVLMSEHSVEMGHVTLELPGDGHNYVEFDCNGFKAVNMKGIFSFDKGLLLPDDSLQRQVSATFEVHAADLNNIMVSTSVSPFQVKGLKGFSFTVKNAVLDLSDFANPGGFSFPHDYQQTYGDDISLWRGFYLQEAEVKLPRELADQGNRTSILASNLLIDEMGVSGLFELRRRIEASADGWPLSIDSIAVQLVRNRLRGGAFAGDVKVPFLGNEPMGFEAQMFQRDTTTDYRFAILTPQDKDYQIPLAGKVKIKRGSRIQVEQRGGKFVPSVLLHGSMTVQAKGVLEIAGLNFENLGLSTRKPYLMSGVFSSVPSKETTGTAADGEQTTLAQPKAANFPISIDSIGLGIYQGQISLGVGVALNFMGGKSAAGSNKEAQGFGARTFVQVLAKVEEHNGPSGDGGQKSQQWKFDRVKVNDILLKCHVMAFDLEGKLSFFDQDKTYGNGFRGSVTFALKKIMDNPIQANAYFGSKSFRYWHVDLYVPTGNIPLVPPISLNGILGGASYHMIRPAAATPNFEAFNEQGTYQPDKDLVYVPDSTAGISFMAGATLVAASDKAFNADAAFEVAFNKGGGLRYVEFRGDGYFFSASDKRSRGKGAAAGVPVYAGLNMRFDNDNDVFHANLTTYLNLAGGIRGSGPGGLVGEAVIHVDPKDWYMYIGRPTRMLSVEVVNLAVAQSYFMIGTKVEDLPLPPPEVASMFKNIDLAFMRDENALSTGKGFAMGARFRVGVDTKEKLMPFYLLMEVGAGADVMLRNYGEAAACRGRDGGLGIDGWYASGQAYVFLKGKVGLCVKGCKKRFDVISLGAAALLQAKLPNPTWMRGAVAGEYSILGGLVKGKVNAKFTIGEECEIIAPGNELGDIQVIADIQPGASATDVNVFSAPQVSFNTAIGPELRMTNNRDEVNTYKIVLDEVKLYQNKQEIAGNQEWNDRRDVVVLNTPEVLPSKAQLKMVVKLHWEKKNGNGGWEALKDEKGQVDYESKESAFTTGLAPDFIPEENVAYSYPVKNQYHFYQQESPKGYIKLKKGQAYLFPAKDSLTAYAYLARFETKSGSKLAAPLSYNARELSVSLDIPASLQNSTVYSLKVVQVPQSSGTIDQNLSRQEKQVTASNSESSVSLADNRLSGTITQSVEKNLYESQFRTSKFNRFADKVDAFYGRRDLFTVAEGNLALIAKRVNTDETFDIFELEGKDERTLPLVQPVASRENAWFKDVINPMLYELYPSDGRVQINWRDTTQLGVAPLKAVALFNGVDISAYQLTSAQAEAGSAPARSGRVTLEYYLSYVAFFDYDELRNEAAALYLETESVMPAGVRRLLQADRYTDLKQDHYPVTLQYVLPGINQVTSRPELKIRF